MLRDIAESKVSEWELDLALQFAVIFPSDESTDIHLWSRVRKIKEQMMTTIGA